MRKNIVILTMSLNIGGAETHIYELACALASKNNNVTVFSAGGVYADKLIDNGVNHITAPLNKKDPASLIKAYSLVDNYARNNRPCVIHSHTRISNFTAYAVARKYNIPFVSTVHFNFTTGILQRILTKWGDRAIAVSEDLKNYTADNYGFDKEKISVTVNGINLNTFCKRNTPEFKSELGLEKDSKVILCVSRLDQIAGDHVYKVLCLAEEIYKSNPESNIVIVGGGTRYNEFCEIAKNINSKTKDKFIQFTGPQTDIYRYCNIADLFIGISRSALEAMACEVPTILLGNSGYLGLYSKETEALCIETNFTCRNCPYPEDREITDLIHDMLINAVKYNDYVKSGYEIVKNRYSVSRMADDALDAYGKAWKDLRPYDMMICGYYGRGNLGDDMAFKALVDNSVKETDANNLILLTADTSKKMHGRVKEYVHRFNIFKILKLMKKTSLFVLGSGSILQDSTSSRSIFYYLYILRKAFDKGCAVMLYSNGIGPITKQKNKDRTAKLLERVHMMTVRDNKSLVYLRSMGISNPNIELTADETFTLDKNEIGDNKCLEEGKKYLGINLRISNIGENFINNFAAFIDDAVEKYGYTPVLFPVHYSQDMVILSTISQKLKCNHILIEENLPHEQTLSILSQCDTTIIERLHAAIFSCIYEKPFLALNYDPKVLSFCTEMGMDDYIIELTNFNKDTVLKQLDSLIENKDNIVRKLIENNEIKRNLAKNNSKLMSQLTRWK